MPPACDQCHLHVIDAVPKTAVFRTVDTSQPLDTGALSSSCTTGHGRLTPLKHHCNAGTLEHRWGTATRGPWHTRTLEHSLEPLHTGIPLEHCSAWPQVEELRIRLAQFRSQLPQYGKAAVPASGVHLSGPFSAPTEWTPRAAAPPPPPPAAPPETPVEATELEATSPQAYLDWLASIPLADSAAKAATDDRPSVPRRSAGLPVYKPQPPVKRPTGSGRVTPASGRKTGSGRRAIGGAIGGAPG